MHWLQLKRNDKKFSAAPAMMAACRYYTVTNGINSPSRVSLRLRRLFVSKGGILCLICGCWLYFCFISGLLIALDQMGKNVHGYCGTKPFHSLSLYLFYLIAFLVFVYISAIGTIFYSYKLSNFIKNHNAQSFSPDETKETEELLRMIKLSAIQPLIFQFLPISLLLLSDLGLISLSMTFGRILAIVFALAALTDPWLTVVVLHPFRREFKKLFISKIVRRSGRIASVPDGSFRSSRISSVFVNPTSNS